MKQTRHVEIEDGIRRLVATGKRLRKIGFLILVILGPPSLFLFVGLMIAMALQQPVAQRAVILFPVLAVVVFGTGVSYMILARFVARGSRPGVIASLSIAVTLTVVGLLDFWSKHLGWDGQDWIVIARMVVAITNALLVTPLLGCLGAAKRVQAWMDSGLASAEE